tara:strand:+ start:53 stop:556 length:504 start_codon:yes stop_codon:yes gene_type:complete
MKDYIIYKIYSNNENINEIYLGMTTDFNKIQTTYKYAVNHSNKIKYQMKLLEYVLLHGGFDNFLFEIIQTYKCETTKEANIYKRKHYDELKPSLNKNRPDMSIEDRFNYQHDYHIINKKEIAMKLKEKDKLKCDCGRMIRKYGVSRHILSKYHLSRVNIIANEATST